LLVPGLEPVTSMSSTIALIRHAEKPSEDGRLVGVDEAGFLDANELTVRGWQRAGALARFFAGFDSGPSVLPSHLVAAAPDAAHPSKRCISTLLPLAGHCGLVVATPFHVGAEDRLVQYLDGLHGLVVVAWEHKRIPALARLLAATPSEVPTEWPQDRFDLVWLLVPDDSGGRRFTQLPQQLLSGDEATVAD
jgi:broad specificity phosphatase PhoE